jgi:oligopeptide/dipeptide ABC transporter ATP-binding protein
MPSLLGGMMQMKNLLLVKDLTKHFPVEKGMLASVLSRKKEVVHACCRVSLSVKEGETLGLVGESGSGKTTFGRCVLRLIEPTSGEIIFDGVDITNLDKKGMKNVRKEMQIVFQDPFSSLNPRMKIGEIVGHPMKLHGIAEGREVHKKVVDLLKAVGLTEEHVNRYPHQFSGGQKQRIAIARALSVNPKFIVLDEPTSSLDVSVQASILNLFLDLKKEFGFSSLFISHDLGVVEHVSERIGVMYLGKLVEIGETDMIFGSPQHPYTKALLAAFPIPDPLAKKEKIIIKGEIPSPIHPPKGCRFHTRCPHVMPACKEEEPKFVKVAENQYVSCHLFT